MPRTESEKKKCTFALKIKALLKVKKEKKKPPPKDVMNIERDKGCEATCIVLSTQ